MPFLTLTIYNKKRNTCDPETSPIGTTDIVTRGFNLWTQAKLFLTSTIYNKNRNMLDPETSPIGTAAIVTRGFNLWTYGWHLSHKSRRDERYFENHFPLDNYSIKLITTSSFLLIFIAKLPFL